MTATRAKSGSRQASDVVAMPSISTPTISSALGSAPFIAMPGIA
jgi:hypothetical protein